MHIIWIKFGMKLYFIGKFKANYGNDDLFIPGVSIPVL